ncbi:SEC-C domain-containing protein [Haloechinothrix sp. LS1_15]|uniref:SEC-C domain-containing protein n=1 Tax=Haloechinothrix sp. LS1_15 TaxID=2652248 RepID=UPI0029476589|nr:SEC-C domain-containing protein [Haloechinothrix sp. LS1_15]MDV6012324.1 SEC-C domain-containing protein [Haloechinothrix sp. LS1_15]
MPTTEQVTSDDLDRLGVEGLVAADPESVIAELVNSVDSDRLADESDTRYALSLAAEIAHRHGDDERALTLYDRAIAAPDDPDDPDGGFTRACRAEVLADLDREDEALAALRELRPLLGVDPGAAEYLTAALVQCGYDEMAEEWLTDALRQLLAQLRDEELSEDSNEAEVLLNLGRQRYELRGTLEKTADDLDLFVEELDGAVEEDAAEDEPEEDGENGVAALFWPRAEFDALGTFWPSHAELAGATWDEHCANVERELVEVSAHGAPEIVLVPGSAAELRDYVSEHGIEDIDLDDLDGFFEQSHGVGEPVPWPPGRNEACWCGSGTKYQKCCLPRSRV